MNNKGQILLPGLVSLLTLLLGFALLAYQANRALCSLRLDLAAQATALSAARAEAEMMNKYASYNLEMNLLVPLRYRGFAGTEIFMKDIIRLDTFQQSFYERPKFPVFVCSVGRRVAQLNRHGCNVVWYPVVPSPQLEFQDVNIVLFDGVIPLWESKFSNLFYQRTWDTNQLHAQPPHKTTWTIGLNGLTASASAQLYLDAKNDKAQNGGFPVKNDNSWHGIGFQSFYPQFNAHLIPTETVASQLSTLVERL